MNAPTLNRRRLLQTALCGVTCLGTGLGTGLGPGLGHAQEPKVELPICVFTKPFNSLSFDALAEKVAQLGFQGIEAPIRPGGHIEPKNVPRDLPKLVEALKRHDLQLMVLTSSVNDPADPLTESVLRTAADLGIRQYRMQYLTYDRTLPVTTQLTHWKTQLQQLAELNQRLGIQAVYQNHAGSRNLGAAIWDLARVLEGIAVEDIGVAYDIRHATVEGGQSWPITFRMIRPHIAAVYVKDFRWIDGRPRNVPLGEGMVSPKFFEMLRASGYQGPVSLHEEYLDHRQPELVPEHWASIERDLKTLREWLSGDISDKRKK